MNKNTEKINLLSKEKADVKREAVINAMDDLLKNNLSITFSSVAKAAEVSRNYLYKNGDFKNIIEMSRGIKINVHSKDTRDLIIASQQKTIRNLCETIEKLTEH